MNIQTLKKILEAIKKNNQSPVAHEIHMIAAAYIKAKGSLNDTRDFIHWLEANPTIIHQQHLLMLSQFLLLETELDKKFPATEIIRLGDTFISTPEKFAGFLYWLLERQVSVNAILDSHILHRYFAYHVWDIDILNNTYQLLKGQSLKTEGFLSALNNQSCEMVGFINDERSNGQFRSRNLKGTFFKHATPMSFADRWWRATFDYQVTFFPFAQQLFKVFGESLMPFLDRHFKAHRKILSKISPLSDNGESNADPRMFKRRRHEVNEIVSRWIAADPFLR